MSSFARLAGRYRVAADPLRSERKFELVALILAALFVLQLIYSGLWLSLPAPISPILPTADSIGVAEVATRQTLSLEQSTEVRARPLFWESRRPLEPVESAQVAQAEPRAVGKLKGVRLLGVFGGKSNAGIIALVNGKRQRVMRGGKISGWKLHAVKSDRVVLSNGRRRQELVIERSFAPGGAAASGGS